MRIAIGLALLAYTAFALGHHSRSHYPEQKQEISGELVAVHWTNPHVGFTVSVTNDEGEAEQWRVEGRSNLFSMERGGATREMFNVGEQVTFLGSESVRRPRDMLATNLLLANGTEVMLDRDAEPRWSEDNVGRYDSRVTQTNLVDALSEDRGIFRVWSWAGDSAVQSRHFPFTDAAIEARAAWDPIDNFLERCEPQGMPGIMMHPHSIEFTDRSTEIELVIQFFDRVRIIHMDVAAPPADTPSSHLGYSVGRWEEGALVVTTTRIDWPYFDGIGTPQSEAIEVVERFTVSEDQGRLHYRQTVTDDATFSEPAVYERDWVALGAAIRPYACQVY